MTVDQVRKLLGRITAYLFFTDFEVVLDYDKKYTRTIEYDSKKKKKSGYWGEKEGRLYLQLKYRAPCTKSGILTEFKGRKWYLSSHMTEDEIIKTAYAAFHACVNHEIMEGFKVDNIILFNPHVSYKELLKVSHKEIKRDGN